MSDPKSIRERRDSPLKATADTQRGRAVILLYRQCGCDEAARQKRVMNWKRDLEQFMKAYPQNTLFRELFKKISSDIRLLIHSLKTEYSKRLIASADNKSKAVWNLIRKETPIRIQRSQLGSFQFDIDGEEVQPSTSAGFLGVTVDRNLACETLNCFILRIQRAEYGTDVKWRNMSNLMVSKSAPQVGGSRLKSKAVKTGPPLPVAPQPVARLPPVTPPPVIRPPPIARQLVAPLVAWPPLVARPPPVALQVAPPPVPQPPPVTPLVVWPPPVAPPVARPLPVIRPPPVARPPVAPPPLVAPPTAAIPPPTVDLLRLAIVPPAEKGILSTVSGTQNVLIAKLYLRRW
ncbi:homeobox protein ESX1-like [Nilaparvata lugens]|uniref:homeobox protein ESX1-like n=1 Tax=Nilaparvata lugens TaxID=108931 RepID=UPI00193D6A54|nr:homeobox protein ESX1-like [Nilaparvata lugens]